MKSELYKWRLSARFKADLEREARVRKVPVSVILESAVSDWLKRSARDATDEGAQRRLHAAAGRCLGVLAGGSRRRAETAREAVRKRLTRCHAR